MFYTRRGFFMRRNAAIIFFSLLASYSFGCLSCNTFQMWVCSEKLMAPCLVMFFFNWLTLHTLIPTRYATYWEGVDADTKGPKNKGEGQAENGETRQPKEREQARNERH